MPEEEKIIMSSQHPLAGMGGKPILGEESSDTHEALLKRIAAAFPARAEKIAITEERKRKIAQERGGFY